MQLSVNSTLGRAAHGGIRARDRFVTGSAVVLGRQPSASCHRHAHNAGSATMPAPPQGPAISILCARHRRAAKGYSIGLKSTVIC